MTTISVHFDGRVFVPEVPVNLPRNTRLQLQIPDRPEEQIETKARFGVKNGFPIILQPAGARTITTEDVKAAMEDEI